MVTVKKKVSKNDLLDFFYNKMDKNDEKLYEEMNGKPLNIFQLTASVGALTTRRVKPKNLDELTACNALARPGTSASLEDYANAKEEGFAKYKNPIIQECLKDTYNIILYQEQIMSLFNKIGGFSLEETNMVRGVLKKLSKKEKKQSDVDKWADNVRRFKENAIKLGIPNSELDLLVKDMAALAGYSFNKSHAISYAAMAALTLYLSKYFKEYWYSAVVEYQMNKDRDTLINCFKVISSNGYIVLPPDINKSKERTFSDGKNIYIGLHNIKGVGAASEAIVAHSPYNSFMDFYNKTVYEKTVRKTSVVALTKFGSFDKMEDLNRLQSIEAVNRFWKNKKAVKAKKKTENTNVEGMISLIENSNKDDKNTEIWKEIKKDVIVEPELLKADNNVLKEMEFDCFGFNYFVSPFSNKMKDLIYKKEEQGYISSSLTSLFEIEKTSKIVPIYITAIRNKIDKNGNEMAFLTVEDVNGFKAVIPIFSSIYGSIRNRLKVGIVCMMLLFSKYSDFSKSKQIMFGTDSFVTPEKATKYVIPIREPE